MVYEGNTSWDSADVSGQVVVMMGLPQGPFVTDVTPLDVNGVSLYASAVVLSWLRILAFFRCAFAELVVSMADLFSHLSLHLLVTRY